LVVVDEEHVERFEHTFDELGLIFTPLDAVAVFEERMSLMAKRTMRRGVVLVVPVRQRQSIEWVRRVATTVEEYGIFVGIRLLESMFDDFI
jgi:hypothetical protein